MRPWGRSLRASCHLRKNFRHFLLTTRTASGSIHSCHGAVAQLGERLNGIQEVRSSILLSSTRNFSAFGRDMRHKIIPHLCLRSEKDHVYTHCGAVAQLGERLNGIQEVRSSILLSSTRNFSAFGRDMRHKIIPHLCLRSEKDHVYTHCGAVAQLGERLNGIQEVRSSILLSSTRRQKAVQKDSLFCFAAIRPAGSCLNRAFSV